MILSLPQNELLEYIRNQCGFFFPDGYDLYGDSVKSAFRISLDRLEECLSVISLSGYHDTDGNVVFSHLHADQYATLLYFFANSLWKSEENKVLCSKLMQLNRSLHSLFISYKCELPEHFVLAHAFGTILGNASYGDYLVVYQGVTVNTGNATLSKRTPHLGKALFLGANAKIIGTKPIGDYVSVGVDAMVYQTEIPDNSTVIRAANGDTIIRPRRREKCFAQTHFSVPI